MHVKYGSLDSPVYTVRIKDRANVDDPGIPQFAGPGG